MSDTSIDGQDDLIPEALEQTPLLYRSGHRQSALVMGALVREVRSQRARIAELEDAAEPADPWCRDEKCEWRHWRSGGIPTHKRGKDCSEVSS